MCGSGGTFLLTGHLFTTAVPVQNLRLGGRSSRAEYQFVMQSLDRPLLYDWSQRITDAMTRDRKFTDVNSDQAAKLSPSDDRIKIGFNVRKIAWIRGAPAIQNALRTSSVRQTNCAK